VCIDDNTGFFVAAEKYNKKRTNGGVSGEAGMKQKGQKMKEEDFLSPKELTFCLMPENLPQQCCVSRNDIFLNTIF
jgi:hypothetical protein